MARSAVHTRLGFIEGVVERGNFYLRIAAATTVDGVLVVGLHGDGDIVADIMNCSRTVALWGSVMWA